MSSRLVTAGMYDWITTVVDENELIAGNHNVLKDETEGFNNIVLEFGRG